MLDFHTFLHRDVISNVLAKAFLDEEQISIFINKYNIIFAYLNITASTYS